MNGKLKNLLKGAMAGAAGTAALNAVGYGDMALRGRAASRTPDQVVEQLARRIGLTIPGSGEAYQSRLEGLDALAGMVTGVAVGAAAGRLPGAGSGRWPARPRSVALLCWRPT